MKDKVIGRNLSDGIKVIFIFIWIIIIMTSLGTKYIEDIPECLINVWLQKVLNVH